MREKTQFCKRLSDCQSERYVVGFIEIGNKFTRLLCCRFKIILLLFGRERTQCAWLDSNWQFNSILRLENKWLATVDVVCSHPFLYLFVAILCRHFNRTFWEEQCRESILIFIRKQSFKTVCSNCNWQWNALKPSLPETEHELTFFFHFFPGELSEQKSELHRKFEAFWGIVWTFVLIKIHAFDKCLASEKKKFKYASERESFIKKKNNEIFVCDEQN